MVRGERPEVTAALADVLTATATALRTFAEPATRRPARHAGRRRAEEGRTRRPPVQQIEIA